MTTDNAKHLSQTLRDIAAEVKRCRQLDQICQAYIRLNGSGDGLASALKELQAAADDLQRQIRAYHKAITDAVASLHQDVSQYGGPQ